MKTSVKRATRFIAERDIYEMHSDPQSHPLPGIMKKTRYQILLAGIFLITACGGTAPPTQTTPMPVIEDPTATSSSLPTTTQTSVPTVTLTASITPLPTIPTFTATFDARTILTVTPAQKAECPEIEAAIKVENYLPGELEYPSPKTADKILAFLNEGGDGLTLIARLEQVYPSGGDYRGGYAFYDVTGDQSPEFLYVEINHEGRLLAFSCKNGRYELLATLPEEKRFLEYTMQLVHLNGNGIPEIIVMGTHGVSQPVSTIYFYEWNGKTFSNIGQTIILALRETKVTDIDENGTKEISFSGDNPTCVSCSNFIPQRQRTVSYGWNGKAFVETSSEFEPPEYRFQAIQDADAAVIVGKYNKAISLYESVISDNTLEWWSPERFRYEQHMGSPVMMFIETPSTIPTEDLTEYARLATYASYRLMLIRFVEGDETEAETAYQSLQEKFGGDPSAQPYLEMATAFWNAYGSTYKIYDGCAAAIQYAAEHPEILIPLGTDYHGWQSHTYVPADVCPFR